MPSFLPSVRGLGLVLFLPSIRGLGLVQFLSSVRGLALVLFLPSTRGLVLRASKGTLGDLDEVLIGTLAGELGLMEHGVGELMGLLSNSVGGGKRGC